jgi:hypothetical protein
MQSSRGGSTRGRRALGVFPRSGIGLAGLRRQHDDHDDAAGHDDDHDAAGHDHDHDSAGHDHDHDASRHDHDNNTAARGHDDAACTVDGYDDAFGEVGERSRRDTAS